MTTRKPKSKSKAKKTVTITSKPTRRSTKKKSNGFWQTGGKLAGAGIGGYFGGPEGAMIGGKLGKKLGHIMQQITGFGDYNIEHNSLMNGGLSPPQIVNSVDKGWFIVRHREYICDINATTAFTKQTFPLNPGLDTTFPWLSQVANAFEQYRWRGLIFEIKSLSSDAVLSSSTSSALGSVICATQYNSVAPAFTSKIQMENYEFANSAKPSVSFIHPVECKNSLTAQNAFYVRSGAVPDNADQRLYDIGELNVATVGMQAASGVCSELWCTYEVEFTKSAFQPQDQADHFFNASYTNALPLGNPFADSNTYAAANGSTLGGSVTGTVYSFPPNMSSGRFVFDLGWIGSGAVAVAYPSLGFTNCNTLPFYRNKTLSAFASPAAGVSSVVCKYQVVVELTGQNASITVGTGGTLPTTPLEFQLFVTKIPLTMIG